MLWFIRASVLTSPKRKEKRQKRTLSQMSKINSAEKKTLEKCGAYKDEHCDVNILFLTQLFGALNVHMFKIANHTKYTKTGY
jgi:hypothetical protein